MSRLRRRNERYLDELSEMIGGRLTMTGTSAVSLSVNDTNTWHWRDNDPNQRQVVKRLKRCERVKFDIQ